jgi:hypothetical protein
MSSREKDGENGTKERLWTFVFRVCVHVARGYFMHQNSPAARLVLLKCIFVRIRLFDDKKTNS